MHSTSTYRIQKDSKHSMRMNFGTRKGSKPGCLLARGAVKTMPEIAYANVTQDPGFSGDSPTICACSYKKHTNEIKKQRIGLNMECKDQCQVMDQSPTYVIVVPPCLISVR
jgi:hypothetical protein